MKKEKKCHFLNNNPIRKLLGLIIYISLLQYTFADVIQLKGDKYLYGQVMAINERDIILETISADDYALEIKSYPLNPIVKIVDESGTVLYEDNTAKFKNLNSFYSLMENNWEELKHKTLDSDRQIITYKSGDKKEKKIVSITKQFVYTESKNPGSEEITLNKISLRDIRAVNNVRVIHTNFDIAKRILLSETKYPLYQIQIGFDYTKSSYSGLQKIFQEFYDQNNLNKMAAKRKDSYPGIFMKFEMYLKPYISLGLCGNYYKGEDLNTLSLIMVDIKYIYHTSLVHPWISVGYAGQQFASKEKVNNVNYEWLNKGTTVCLGTGLNTGKEPGLGFNLSVYYLPFGEGKTKIKVDDLESTSSKKIDFSLLKISLGMHYSFN